MEKRFYRKKIQILIIKLPKEQLNAKEKKRQFERIRKRMNKTINRRTGRHEVKATGKGTFKSRGREEKEEERFCFIHV